MAWTPELKQEVVDAYLAKEPTSVNSSEIVKELATKYEQSPNGLRMVLQQAGVYVKKADASAGGSTGTKKSASEGGTKRVSKEEQIGRLSKLIADRGKDVDEEILSKLTGKAAQYLVSVFGDE